MLKKNKKPTTKKKKKNEKKKTNTNTISIKGEKQMITKMAAEAEAIDALMSISVKDNEEEHLEEPLSK